MYPASVYSAVFLFLHVVDAITVADNDASVLIRRAAIDAQADIAIATHASMQEHVVLRTHGAMNQWLQHVIESYLEQLKSSGAELGVLRDVTNLTPEQASLNLLELDASDSQTMSNAFGSEMVRSWRYNTPWGSVPFCDVTWSEAKQSYKKSLSWQTGPHSWHGPYQAVWWSRCAKEFKTKADRIWFLESDVVFTGNVANFFKAFDHEDADLIAAGFRIAGQHWWCWNDCHELLQKNFTNFNVNSGVVKNLNVIPTLAQGTCSDGNWANEDDKEGFVFHQDHIERFKPGLLDMMLESIQNTETFLASEAWAPTVCASHAGKCTMYDFAPMLAEKRNMYSFSSASSASSSLSASDNQAHSSWVSPLYCFADMNDVGKHVVGKIGCEGCELTEEWTNKWIHPVKKKKDWSPANCKCI